LTSSETDVVDAEDRDFVSVELTLPSSELGSGLMAVDGFV
jgi:hypothetical protein